MAKDTGAINDSTTQNYSQFGRRNLPVICRMGKRGRSQRSLPSSEGRRQLCKRAEVSDRKDHPSRSPGQKDPLAPSKRGKGGRVKSEVQALLLQSTA